MTKNNSIICPACGSNEISRPQLSRRAMAISILLIGFPLVFIKKEFHCFDCGIDFRIKKNHTGVNKK
jgi:predicted RNA-binding Zn-ribbon protein involved in translation (DUF1610 family)